MATLFYKTILGPSLLYACNAWFQASSTILTLLNKTFDNYWKRVGHKPPADILRPVNFVRKSDLILAYKILNAQTIIPPNKHFKQNNGNYTRSQNRRDLVPRKYPINDLVYQDSFFNRVISDYNQIPQNLREAPLCEFEKAAESLVTTKLRTWRPKTEFSRGRLKFSQQKRKKGVPSQ